MAAVYTPPARLPVEVIPEWRNPLRMIQRWRERALIAEDRVRAVEAQLCAYAELYSPDGE